MQKLDYLLYLDQQNSLIDFLQSKKHWYHPMIKGWPQETYLSALLKEVDKFLPTDKEYTILELLLIAVEGEKNNG